MSTQEQRSLVLDDGTELREGYAEVGDVTLQTSRCRGIAW